MSEPKLRPLELFVRAVLSPAIDAVGRQRTSLDTSIADASLYEAYMWLELGVRLRVYPQRETEILVLNVLPTLCQHLDSFPSWYFFPHVKSQLIAANRSKQLFRNLKLESDAMEIGVNHFQSVLLQVMEKAENPATRALTSALLFADDSRWKKLISAQPSEDSVMQAMLAEYDPWADGYRSLIYAGWFLLVKDIENIIEMFGNDRRPKFASLSAWISFKSDIVALHGWRFRTKEPRYTERLQEITKGLGEIVSKASTYAFQVDVGGLQEYVLRLIYRWNEFAKPFEQVANR